MAIKNRNVYKGFISSLKIGWRIETNWASPINVLFVKTIRPISLGNYFVDNVFRSFKGIKLKRFTLGHYRNQYLGA